jgi:hypothetical protein
MPRSCALFAVMLLLASAVAASAQITPPWPQFEVWMDGPGGHVWVTPAGTGPSLAQAHALGPGLVDATIHLEITDTNGDPIFGYPYEDMWIEGQGPGFAFCIGGTVADADTDTDGRTTFAGPFAAGGQILPPDQPVVVVAGAPVPNTDLPLTVNSPDVNGDLHVDLADIALFIQAIGEPYDLRFDFDLSGGVDLTDVAIFASAIGQECP